MELTVYMGFDDREPLTYKIAEYSIKKFSPNIKVVPLIQSDLRQRQIYNRAKDEKASTQFSLTRFLTPYLNKYKDWALFIDSDVILTCPIENIMEFAFKEKALMCVHHDYSTTQSIKMDGQINHIYPKKNYSSVMLFNCAHPANRVLNVKLVNTAEPSYLHQFKWLNDSDVGHLPKTWNYLVGEYPYKEKLPELLHMTLGSPEVGCKSDYDWLWYKMKNEMNGVLPIKITEKDLVKKKSWWDFFKLGHL